MTSLTDAKNKTEIEGTEKAKKFKKTARNAILGLTIVIVLFMGTYVVSGRIQKEKDSNSSANSVATFANAPQSGWKKISLPPSGKSERIPVPPGMRVSVTGQKISVHTVYENGTECSQSSEGQKQSCPDGLVIGVYITNKAEETNTVSYAYEKN